MEPIPYPDSLTPEEREEADEIIAEVADGNMHPNDAMRELEELGYDFDDNDDPECQHCGLEAVLCACDF